MRPGRKHSFKNTSFKVRTLRMKIIPVPLKTGMPNDQRQMEPTDQTSRVGGKNDEEAP